MDIDTKPIESLSESLFNPLELNNDDVYSPLCDVDPDANYFNELNAHISQNCNYYYEHSFSIIIQTRFKNMIDLYVFSLCHINQFNSIQIKFIAILLHMKYRVNKRQVKITTK